MKPASKPDRVAVEARCVRLNAKAENAASLAPAVEPTRNWNRSTVNLDCRYRKRRADSLEAPADDFAVEAR